MKKYLSSLLAGAALYCGGSLSSHAISNPGFETGDFSGWTVNGPADVTTAHNAIADPRVYAPMEGSYFARLSSGLGAGVYTTISQAFTLNAGESVFGSAAFDAGDEFPDNAFLTIQGSGGPITLWSAIITDSSYGSTPWQPWSFTAPASDTYVITFGIANGDDNEFNSIALLDFVGAQVSVPDTASTIALLAITMLGIGAIRNRTFGLQS